MASVIQPGWVLLLVCSALLLIMGWYLLQRSDRDSFQMIPLVTPIYGTAPLWTPQPLLTLPPLIQPTTGIPPTETRFTPHTTPPLLVESPTCYDGTTHHLLCMGRVYNPLNVPVENIVLDIQVSSAEYGTFVKTTLSEQQMLPPNGFAPYHARFTDFQKLYEETIQVDVLLHETNYSHHLPLPLPILAEQFDVDAASGQYLLTGTVYNAQPRALRQVEIVGMLIDSAGRITGYRVLRLRDGLDAGEKRAVELRLTSQILDPHITYRFTASGWNEPPKD